MLDTKLEKLDNGHTVRVARLGSGPPLLLLHGYPENLQIFTPLARILASDFEVIAFDWPGMGASTEWKEGASPTHMARRLIALMDAWNIERATIAGMDMGGQPALVAAAEFPERIERLVVMNSLVLWDEDTSWEIALLRKVGFNTIAIENLPFAVFRRAEMTFLPAGVRLPRALRGDLWDHFKRKPVRKYISRMCAGYEGSLKTLPRHYANVACPTLILWGECDKHFPPGHARRLHELVPDSTLRILEGAEHWMAWYQADLVAHHIRSWVR